MTRCRAADPATRQEDVLRFLGEAASYGLAAAPVRIDTHSSVVFLAGSEVYKVKRAIKLPFLDYSTLEKRRIFCEREFTVNHDLAPTLYKGIIAITRAADGLRIGGSGEIVEWAVHLHRFDETQTLDRIAESGALDEPIIRALADVVFAAHSAAKVVRTGDATPALENVVDETLNELSAAVHFFPHEKLEAFSRTMRGSFDKVRALLAIREATGHVRRCHGDTHLRNIVMLDGRATLFDAIEFDEKLATIDTLYDLAFLLMDLWEKRLVNEANAVLNRYLWQVDDLIDELSGLAALPVLLSLRAAIRAKVAVLNAPNVSGASDEVGRYFDIARDFLKSGRPSLIAIGGRSGTGKSTLARRLAPHIGRPPGAVHLRSDIERKRQHRVAETTRLPASAYRPDISGRVYEALDRQASTALLSGHSVIIDATFLDDFEARAAAALARCASAEFHGIWLEAPTDLLIRRLNERRNDASDATAEIVRCQPVNEAPPGWIRIDAAGTPEKMRDAVLALMG